MTGARGTALVTGASAGLGWAYALSLAERGHPLILVARRAERLEALAAAVEKRFAVEATVVAADLGTQEGRAICRAAVDAADPPLEVAVINAGFGSRGPLVELDREREVAMVELNCVAVVDLAAHVLPGMVARGRGDLIVVSSAAAFQPVPFMATYAATKAFELHLVEGLAGEVAGTGVRVVAVCPGPTRTEFSTGRRRVALALDVPARRGRPGRRRDLAGPRPRPYACRNRRRRQIGGSCGKDRSRPHRPRHRRQYPSTLKVCCGY